MLSDLNAGCWTDSQVRLMLEAVSRGAMAAVLEHEEEKDSAPVDRTVTMPTSFGNVRLFDSGGSPQIDAGILMFRRDSDGVAIGRARAITAGTRVIEVVDDIVQSDYLGEGRIQLGEYVTLTEDFDSVIANVEDRYNASGTYRSALLIAGTGSSSGLSDSQMLTKAAAVPSGWTTKIYRLQHGTSTYDTAHPVAGVALRAQASNGRILEQWFRRDDLPTPSGTTKIWMVHTADSFSTVMTPLQVGKTWDVRTYRYRLTPCDHS